MCKRKRDEQGGRSGKRICLRQNSQINYSFLNSPFKKSGVVFTPITARKIRSAKRLDDKNLKENVDNNSFKTPQDMGLIIEQLLSGTKCFDKNCPGILELCKPNTAIIDLCCSVCNRVYQVKSTSSDLYVYFNDEFITTGSRKEGERVIGVPANQLNDLKDLPIFICIRMNKKDEDYYIDNKKSYVLIPELILTSDAHYIYRSSNPKDTIIKWNPELVAKKKLDEFINIQKLQKRIN
jgi:hypothetical protein